MNKLINHAKTELKALGYNLDQTEEDPNPNKWIVENLLELIEVFSKQGHSGSSAHYCIKVFKKLALFEPLCPLTGEGDEWNEVVEGALQNKRCSHVFKEKGRAYDIHGRVFREPDGICYTNSDSRTYIEFPYTPKTEYVDVPKTE